MSFSKIINTFLFPVAYEAYVCSFILIRHVLVLCASPLFHRHLKHLITLAFPAVSSPICNAFRFSFSWFWVVFQPERADGAAAEATVITSLSGTHSPALWAPLGFPFLNYQHNTHFIVRLFDRSEVLAFIGATSPSATRLWFSSP